MSSVEIAAPNGPDKNAPAPVGMVTHLKNLIESLPVCVMRTDLEGCLLAANDSALQLLGVTEHAKVLTKSLTERIGAEHVEDWRGFLRRSWSEGASSVECELIDFAGAHRIVVVKSVAQPLHADGIQSLILTAQDLSSRRRLERALNEHQGCATTIDGLRAELQQSETQRQRLATLLKTFQSAPGNKSAEPDSGVDALKQQIADLQGALAAKEQEWQHRCDELTAKITQHDAERQQLTSLLEERLAEHQRTSQTATARDAEQQTAIDMLRDRLAELERAIVTNDQEWQKRCDDVSAQLAGQAAERQTLSQLREEHEAERQRMSGLLEQRDAERKELAGLLEQREAERKELAGLLEQRDAERKELSGLLEQRDAERKELAGLLEQRAAERRQHSGMLEQREAEHRQLAGMLEQRITDHQAAGEALQRRVRELERSLKATEVEWQKRCDELTTQLTKHAITGTLQQRIGELEAAVTATEQEWQKRCDELTAQLTEHAAARLQLTSTLERRDADHTATTGTLQQRIGELEAAMTATEQEWQKRCEELTAQLAEHAAVRLQLTSALERHDADHVAAAGSLQERIGALEHTVKATEQAWQKRVDEMTAQLASVSAERQRLTGLLDRYHNDHRTTGETLQRRIEELERSLKANEEEWQQQRVELSAKLAAHVAEQERLSAVLKQRDDDNQRLSGALKQHLDDYGRQSALVKQHESERQKLTVLLQQRDTEHHAAVDGLQQQIVECERALTANDEAWKQRCEELSSQLTAQDAERKERWEALTAQLAENATERRRLSDLLEHRETEQRRLAGEHAAEKIRIEQSVRGECERTHADVEATRRREIEALRQDTGQLAHDLQRTAEQLAQRTAEYETLMVEMQALAQDAVDPVHVEGLMKSVAAYRIELVQITENTTRTLEPMATAGRVAIASSRELQAAVEAVDARSRELLAHCALDDVNRPEIERLRRDSIGAASLVRQLLQVFGDSARANGNEPESVAESH